MVFKRALRRYTGFISDGTLTRLSTHERICEEFVYLVSFLHYFFIRAYAQVMLHGLLHTSQPWAVQVSSVSSWQVVCLLPWKPRSSSTGRGTMIVG